MHRHGIAAHADAEEDQKKVATIGEVIRASIKDTPDKEAALTQIARILWIANQKGHSIDGIYFTPEEDEYNVGQIIADCDSIKRWDCPGADVRATVETFQNISRKLSGE